MQATKIQFLLRDDFPEKSGGDLILAREYVKAFTEAGIDARLDPISKDALADRGSVAQIFNVDRYFEFVASASALQAAGRRYVVAPVHHPLQYVNHFESAVRSGPLGLIAKVGRTAYGRERIKHVIRGRNRESLVESLRSRPREAVAEALRAASLVVVQAPSETEELDRSFGADVRSSAVWVPNGVSFDPALDLSDDRDIDVLVAGRIEERKNPLAIAEALAGSPWQVTFVGGDNRRNAAYAARFHRLVSEHENLHHVPHVSLDELRRLYARSKVFLSASFFEVVSLAELEAVAYGCRLISTTSGYMKDYLGDFATYIEPTADPTVIRDMVDAALRGGLNLDGMAHVREHYSWSRSHRALLDAYENAGLLEA